MKIPGKRLIRGTILLLLMTFSVAGFAASVLTLGNYPNATIITGGNTTVTPDAAPTNTTSITAATSTNFKGTLAVNPTNGVVTVTDAHVAGIYTVTVTAFGTGGTVTKTFTLTVNNPASCAVFGFSPAAGSPVSLWAGNPYSEAVGDFNSDGKQDLAVVNQGSNLVTILLGNGSGGFSQAAGSPFVAVAGTNPESVAVGDFNGDGKQDLAVANASSNNVTILLGNGSGGFTPAAGSPVAAGSGPRFVLVGDFNGDGKQDLAEANSAAASVTILLGNGSGGFSQAAGSPVGVGGGPFSIALGDFNGDGKQDLAVANGTSNNVTILLGNGSGGFTPAAGSPVAAGSGPSFIVAGDFNGDGKQDLAAANSAANTVTILLGNGSGGFTSPGSPVGTGSGIENMAMGDFNGDGKQDLAVATPGSNSVTILLGNGSGGFSQAAGSPISVGGYSSFVVVGDFNSDGKQDLAVMIYSPNNVVILLANCSIIPPPVIMADAPLTRQQGSPGAVSTIARVNDSETAAGLLTVAATTVPAGLTVTGITNTSGTITASVAALCNAPVGANTVVLTVTNGRGLTATANLTVNVTANTPPTLGTYPSSPGTIVTPSAPPGDNGTITSLTASAPGFTGSLSVNPATGVVTISTAPPGTYTVTVTATDNCGATTNASFTINGQYVISGVISYCISPGKPVAGATLTTVGTSSQTTTSGANGNYILTLASGSYTVTPAKTGDINGISAYDAALITRQLKEGTTPPLNTCQFQAEDANNNGMITLADAQVIAEYVVGKNPSSIVSNWKFTPLNLTFMPPSGNLTGQNFGAALVGEVSGNWQPASTLAIAVVTSAAPQDRSGGKSIRVNGYDFKPGLKVLLTFPDGVEAVLSESQIKELTADSFVMPFPLRAPGTWAIRIINPDGSQSRQFSFTVRK